MAKTRNRKVVLFAVLFATVSTLASLLGPVAVAVAAQSATCNGRQATIIGSDDGEVIQGTKGDDVIHGLGGADRIDGLGGNDTICGGSGNDRIKGSAGDDVLLGEGGRDSLSGGSGSDWLSGGDGKDKVRGGPDDDTCTDTTGADTEDQCEFWQSLPPRPSTCTVLRDTYGGCLNSSESDFSFVASHSFFDFVRDSNFSLSFGVQGSTLMRLEGKTYLVFTTRSVDFQPRYLGAFLGAVAYEVDDGRWTPVATSPVLGENGVGGYVDAPEVHVVKNKAVFVSNAGSFWQGVEIFWAKAFGFDGKSFTWLTPYSTIGMNYDETNTGRCNPCEAYTADLEVTNRLRGDWPKLKVTYSGTRNEAKSYTMGPAGVYTRYPKKQRLPDSPQSLLAAFIGAGNSNDVEILRNILERSERWYMRSGSSRLFAVRGPLSRSGPNAQAAVGIAGCGGCGYMVSMRATERGWRIFDIRDITAL